MPMHDTRVDPRAERLRAALGGRILLAGDPGYDTGRLAWNLAVDQRPLAVAHPRTVDDVVDVVRAAAAADVRVAPQATGHAAAALAGTDLSDVVLLNLGSLRGVTLDPVARTARVLGGSWWNDVLEAASPHGLTALHGSAGDVGVVGYILSGGLSFYARHDGLAVGDVRAVQVVTAAGDVLTASAEENPDLFWALRGGSGAFGVVVSIEIALRPYADVYAGMLLWEAAHAPEVARAWAMWTRTAPETATTTLRILNVPPMPDLPPFLSGRSLIVIDGAVLDTDAAASELLQPLRDLGPEMDTFARIPARDLITVHMDPPGPTPAATSHVVLDSLPDEAVQAFLEAGADPGLFITEVRQLGGAIGRRHDAAGAVGSLAGEYLAHTIALVPAPAAAAAADAAVRGGTALFERWRIDALSLTFIDSENVDRAPGFGGSRDRLREFKHRFDPAGLFAPAQPV